MFIYCDLCCSKYDIRIGDCFALVSQTEDERVRRIADDIARSTHRYENVMLPWNFCCSLKHLGYTIVYLNRTANDELEIPLAGKDFRVVFLRFKKQQQHLWKSNNE
jgi:hypothetical protein